jgi:hypothetical protein
VGLGGSQSLEQMNKMCGFMYLTVMAACSQTLYSINIMRGVMHTTVGFGGSPTLAYMNMVYFLII